jgi:hypothetical protein
MSSCAAKLLSLRGGVFVRGFAARIAVKCGGKTIVAVRGPRGLFAALKAHRQECLCYWGAIGNYGAVFVRGFSARIAVKCGGKTVVAVGWAAWTFRCFKKHTGRKKCLC